MYGKQAVYTLGSDIRLSGCQLDATTFSAKLRHLTCGSSVPQEEVDVPYKSTVAGKMHACKAL